MRSALKPTNEAHFAIFKALQCNSMADMTVQMCGLAMAPKPQQNHTEQVKPRMALNRIESGLIPADETLNSVLNANIKVSTGTRMTL